MGESTGISWTEATWNPWMGCTKVSPGCAHCYMFREQRQYGNDPELIRRSKTKFNFPLKLDEPTLIFTCSWSDWFHEDADEWRDEAWDIIRRSPQHTFQILTKRPEAILERLPDDWEDGYSNVWLGVSIENARFASRAEALREVPAALRFISAEPLLGSLFQDRAREASRDPDCRAGEGSAHGGAQSGPEAPRAGGPLDLTGIGWVIVGGESGARNDARPMNPAHARELRDACEEAGIPFHFKQWGSWTWDIGAERLNSERRSKRVDKRNYKVWRDDAGEPEFLMRYMGPTPHAGGKLLDGVDHCAIPERTNVST